MKRRNHILLDMMRSMMCFMDLSISFWGYALKAAAYALNKVPSKSISSTSYKIWKWKRSSLKHLKIWDCPAYVKNIDGYKLSAKSKKYKFMDYPKKSIEYYFITLLNKRCLLVGISFSWKKSLSKKGAMGGLLNLRKFKIYNPSKIHKLILNQMCPLLRYSHYTTSSPKVK